MARQKITQIRAAGLGQIPGASFDTGAVSSLNSLASTFDGIADKLSAREDQAAEREGSKAGALAGSKGVFERRDDATIRGEAFNISAETTFQQVTSAKVKVRLAEFEREFAQNSAGYRSAVQGYAAGVVKEVNSVSPAQAEIFSTALQLQITQGEGRIFKAEQIRQEDAAKSAALLTSRSLAEDAAQSGRDVDFDDPNSVAEYFAGQNSRRAQFRASMMGVGPNGPLFTEKERAVATLAFQDEETETAIMARFNHVLAAGEGVEGPNALELLKSFTDGEDLKVTVIDEDTGKTTTRTVPLRDELRADIVRRMRSALKAQRSEITFQRVTEDRLRNTRQATASANLDLAISRNESNENDVEAAFRRGEVSPTQRVDRLKQIATRDRALEARKVKLEKVEATLSNAAIKLKRTEANATLDLAISEGDMDAAGVNAAHQIGVLTDVQRTARLQQIAKRDELLAKGEIKDLADVAKMKRTEANTALDLAISRGEVNEAMIEAAHDADLLTDVQKTARLQQVAKRKGAASKDRIKSLAAVLKEKQTDANARLDLGIARRQVNEQMVEAAHRAGLLTDQQRTARQKQIITRDSAATERKAAILRVQSEGGFFDPKIKEDRDAVDFYFDDVIAPATAEMDPPSQDAAINEYVKRVGIVPRAVKQAIHGSLRQGPSEGRDNAEELTAAKVRASAMLGRIAETTPAVLKDFTSEEKDLGISINTLVKAGVDPAEAVLRAEQLRDVPDSEREVRKRRRQEDDHVGLNDTFLDETFPDGALGDAFIGEFNDLQQRAYIRTGSVPASQAIAETDMRRVWALTGVGSVSGDLRMMKYAPERFGPFSSDDAGVAANTEWMQKQFLQDIKAELTVNAPPGDVTIPAAAKRTTGVGIGRAPGLSRREAPAGVPGEDFIPGEPVTIEREFSIMADAITAREADSGRPSYRINRMVNGALVPFFDEDGDAMRWSPDWQLSDEKKAKDKEAAAALSGANEKRKTNSDTNADVRQVLDNINKMRERLNQRTGVTGDPDHALDVEGGINANF